MITAAAPAKPEVQPKRSRLAIFASVKLTVVLLILIAATVLLGAWCPQSAQVGEQKVVEQFGEETASVLIKLGVADIFHTPFFLLLIGLLTINMIACSMQRVFPKVRTLRQPLPWLKSREISKLPVCEEFAVNAGALTALSTLEANLRKGGYNVRVQGTSLVAEWGKFGRLAPTVTHIGLLTLLAGVTISSWTGFSGFQPVPLGGSMSFENSEHSKLWIGKLPVWRVQVDATRREDYASGEAKQWYSDLRVIDGSGKTVVKQQISVNNPLSYDGVDIYQSSWGLDTLQVSFNGHRRSLQLRPMGKLYAAFLPLDETTILIFSVRDAGKPLRVFGKTQRWEGPRLLVEIPAGGSADLGSVKVTYDKVIPATGLQYKCDPGLPLTYVAFGFIICGVMLAAVPHRQVWACVQERQQDLNESELPTACPANACILSLGGRSVKAKTAFAKNIANVALCVRRQLGEPS